MALIVKNLHVSVQEKELLHGVSFDVPKGEVHVIMGPNGGGKSTLANTLMGHPKYTITAGTIVINGVDVTHAKPDVRAKQGLFLSMQYPPEIEGVGISHFLRTAKEALTGERIAPLPFHKELVGIAQTLGLSDTVLSRSINHGFSGGEKKRLEMLQLFTLKPTYAILDETDSGLDVDGLRVVGEAIQRFRTKDTGVILITHYTRILEYVTPDTVHVLINGKVVKTGGPELAKEIDTNGYGAI